MQGKFLSLFILVALMGNITGGVFVVYYEAKAVGPTPPLVVPIVGGGMPVADAGVAATIANGFNTEISTLAPQAYATAVATATGTERTLANWATYILETSINYAAYVAYTQLLSILTEKMIAWINGEEGSRQKLFVDWQNDLTKIADNAGGAFVGSLTGMNLCNFSPNLNIPALLQEPSFAQRAECSLGDISRELQRVKSDIEDGDWTNWIRLSQAPAYNPYALLLMAEEEKLNEKTRKTEAAKNEALAGGGFMSVRRCTDQGGSDVTNGSANNVRIGGDEVRYLDMSPAELQNRGITCEVTTPGNVVQGFANKASLAQFDQINASVASLVSNLGVAGPFVVAIGNALVNRIVTFGFTKAVSALTPSQEQELNRLPSTHGSVLYSTQTPSGSSSYSYFLNCNQETDPLCSESIRSTPGALEGLGLLGNYNNQTRATQARSRATVDLQNYFAKIRQLVGPSTGVLYLAKDKQALLRDRALALTGDSPDIADAKKNTADVLAILENKITFYEAEEDLVQDLFNKLDSDLSYILKTGPEGTLDTNGIPGIQAADDPALDTDGDGVLDAAADLTEFEYVNTLGDRLTTASTLFDFYNGKLIGSPSAYDIALVDDNAVVAHAGDFVPPPAAL